MPIAHSFLSFRTPPHHPPTRSCRNTRCDTACHPCLPTLPPNLCARHAKCPLLCMCALPAAKRSTLTHPPPSTHTPPPALSNSNTTHFTSPHHRTTQTPPHPVCDATRATTAQTTRRTCASCMRVTAAMHANQTSPCRTHDLSQPARPPSIQSISPVPIPVLAQISKLPRYTSMAPHDKPSIHQWTS